MRSRAFHQIGFSIGSGVLMTFDQTAVVSRSFDFGDDSRLGAITVRHSIHVVGGLGVVLVDAASRS